MKKYKACNDEPVNLFYFFAWGFCQVLKGVKDCQCMFQVFINNALICFSTMCHEVWMMFDMAHSNSQSISINMGGKRSCTKAFQDSVKDHETEFAAKAVALIGAK